MTVICDFCSAPDVEWVYSADDFPIEIEIIKGKVAPYGSTGAWAACETCSSLIEHGHDEQLTRRSAATSGVVKLYEQVLGMPMPRQERRILEREIGRYHAKFRETRRGARRPFG